MSAAAGSSAQRAGEVAASFWSNVGIGIDELVLPALACAFGIAILGALVATRGETRKRRREVGGFLFAFALTGATAGTVAGVSMEGIVGATLTGVLGIVSAMLAYLFGKESLSSWRPTIPLALNALLIAALFGLIIGGSRRSIMLDDQDTRAQAKFHFEQVEVPVEREKALMLLRKCIDAYKIEDAVKQCE